MELVFQRFRFLHGFAQAIENQLRVVRRGALGFDDDGHALDHALGRANAENPGLHVVGDEVDDVLQVVLGDPSRHEPRSLRHFVRKLGEPSRDGIRTGAARNDRHRSRSEVLTLVLEHRIVGDDRDWQHVGRPICGHAAHDARAATNRGISD